MQFLPTPEVLRAAGFCYRNQGSTTYCLLCRLEVSSWTNDMNPFVVHSEGSPNCIFVRKNYSSNNTRTRSSFSNDNGAERPAKRQKVEISYSLPEIDTIKQCRRRTFSHWNISLAFRYRLAEAGFFRCNKGDRVICIHCNLICHNWNFELDDPCEVHRIISPNCLFVKSMLCSNYNHIGNKSPVHSNYLDRQKRLLSFSNWSNEQFPSIEKLVEAGFFCNNNNNQITCFYCDGSFSSWESHYHPLAEHIRWHPSCNYARQLCGEELFVRIERASKPNIRISELQELNGKNHEFTSFDKNTVWKYVNARLDLPVMKHIEKSFDRTIIQRCLYEQFQFHGDDFINVSSDLLIACYIRKKQIDLIDNDKDCIISPSISLREIYENRQTPFFTNFIETYDELSASFEKDFQISKDRRQQSGLHFIEDREITYEREISLDQRLSTNQSRLDMIIGGWNKSNTDDNLTVCSHCHMQYKDWKSGDNPFEIHLHLSPFCPFILAKKPFGENSIPIRSVHDQFSNSDIQNANLKPYGGVVKTKQKSVFEIWKRINSFGKSPANPSINVEEIAKAGFFITQSGTHFQCYYCNFRVSITNQTQETIQNLVRLHNQSRCPYAQQLNDIDSYPSNEQASSKCTWCMKEDKHIVALSCRHYCLCKSCSEYKKLCPICKVPVTSYLAVYSS